MLGSNTSILIVEDDQIVRNTIVEYLKEHELFPVEAHDGLTGLQKARLQKFQIIITDIDLPKMNGVKLVEELRKLDNHKTTPIVVLSAYLNKETILDVKDQVQKILVKPVEMQELVNTIKVMAKA